MDWFGCLVAFSLAIGLFALRWVVFKAFGADPWEF